MIAYALSALLGVALMFGLPLLLLVLFGALRSFHSAGLQRVRLHAERDRLDHPRSWTRRTR